MDLFFCDICDESIPASDLERGLAFRRAGRIVCAACDRAMSLNVAAEGAGAEPAQKQEPKSAGPAAAASSSETSSTAKPAGGRLFKALWGVFKLSFAAGLVAAVAFLFVTG